VRFSHLYIEERALCYPLTEMAMACFDDAVFVIIDSYKNLFNRPRQDFGAQKKSVKLILAVKSPPFCYEVSDNCQTFGLEQSHYTTPMLGCPYDCDYCYLHGKLPSANQVLFVNTRDFQDAATALVAERKDPSAPVQLSLAYDTDLLPFEKELDLCRDWIALAKKTPDLVVEIRTKSAAYKALKGVAPVENVRLAWSLSPVEVIRRYEHRAPSLARRLESMKQAARDGWSVRPCIDPVIPVKGWQTLYKDMIDTAFKTLPPEAVDQVAVGSFRLGEGHLKRMKKERPHCDLFYRPLQIAESDLEAFVDQHLCPHFSKEKIALWKPPS
jgi:spore photoproduct lyase